MQTEIINIGDELLIGQVVNTNCSQMSKLLGNSGFAVSRVVVVADKKDAILQAVRESLERADIVLVTGGLGPTKDDVTKSCLLEIFKGELVENEQVSRHVQKIFSDRGLPFTQTNRLQAFLPSTCKPVFNKVGTAPGMIFENGTQTLISLPGVPFEMELMMKDVLEILSKKYHTSGILHQTLALCGISESFLSDKLESFEQSLDHNIVSLAYLPKGGILRLRLSCYNCENGNDQYLLDKFSELKTLLSDYVVGQADEDLPELIGNLLLRQNSTLSTAESCTGGMIAHKISLVSGASRYYKGSVVSYCNEIKHNVLHVDKETLTKHHAVSKQTVTLMAKGAIETMNTDYSVAVSGLAGPQSDGTDVPVGTLWICAMNKSGKNLTRTTCYHTTRENFIDRASNEAMFLLLELIRSVEKSNKSPLV